MKNPKAFLFLFIILALANTCSSQQAKRFKALVLYETVGHHILFSAAAKDWLNNLAVDSSFSVTYINNTNLVNDSLLRQYQLIIQLDYPPYKWTDTAMAAFQNYIGQGWGGWIGLHHAGLLGEFDGYPMWQWFSRFMGAIEFKNYIPSFADGLVNVEDTLHPCMKGLPKKFIIKKEEWYTYNKSPRSKVKVLASVNESTYSPPSDIRMGDHPVVWSNVHYAAKNIYIFMGHSPELFTNNSYTTLFRNAIFWAASKP
ncbi:MAG: ThuA domain-containing protein [Ferruginibacter sp.]